MQNNPLLNQLAFDIVKDKAIEDRTKEIMKEQENEYILKMEREYNTKKYLY